MSNSIELDSRDRWKLKAVARIVLDAIEMDRVPVWFVKAIIGLTERFPSYDFIYIEGVLKIFAEEKMVAPGYPAWEWLKRELLKRPLPGEPGPLENIKVV